MVADRLILIALSLLAASVFPAPVFSAAAPEVAQPFTVQDLVRLERISEPCVAPDGKRIAYTLRTTDMDANKARTGVWLLDTRKRNAQPVRLTDLAATAGSREWSADGKSLYYLSDRSGSNQVWRIGVRGEASPGDSSRGEAPREDAVQVTHLPLDVGSFRVAPTGDRILVSLEVFIDCPDLACTKQRLETAAHQPPRTACCTTSSSCGTGTSGATAAARSCSSWHSTPRASRNGTPLLLSGGIDGDVPGKPFGAREDFAFSPNGREVAFSVRARRLGEPWSTNFDIYLVDATGGGTPKT